MFIAFLTRFDRLAGLATATAIALTALFTGFAHPLLASFHQPVQRASDQIRSDLPWVAASGLTFLEMDHYEKPELLSRLYYLTDHTAAIKYANATIFESMAEIAKYFPIRAKVASYRDFVAANRHFLVFGTIDYPEDWLLRKLSHEGANVREMGVLKGLPYKDYYVYDVTIPAGAEALRE